MQPVVPCFGTNGARTALTPVGLADTCMHRLNLLPSCCDVPQFLFRQPTGKGRLASGNSIPMDVRTLVPSRA